MVATRERRTLKEKEIQVFPEMFFQAIYYVPQIVFSKDSTLEEIINTLVDKRAYINKAAEYIREDINCFSDEQPE